MLMLTAIVAILAFLNLVVWFSYGLLSGIEGTTSLLFGTLQIEVDVATRRLLFIWGYHPLMKAHLVDIQLPKPTRGALFIASGRPFTPGVSLSIAEADKVVTYLDPDSGWIQISKSVGVEVNKYVEFATGTIAGLHEDALTSLFLKPQVDP